MNLSDVMPRVHAQTAEVEVVGDCNGDLLVVVKQGEFRNFVTNKGNGQIKRFREPRSLSKYLCEKGVRKYTIHLEEWDITKIFDRHKAATLLRAK